MKGLRMVRGWVRLSVTGDFAERFYNLLVQEGLQPYDLIRRDDGALVLSLPIRRFGRIRAVRRRTGVRVRIEQKGGLPRLLWRYRRRWGLAVGALVAALIVFLMSGFVWSIRFEGQVKDEAALLEVLAQAGLREGCWRAGVDADAVESCLLESELGLSFASVVMQGSVAQVQIEYARPKPPIESLEPCHIVAAQDGVITYMMVEQGVPKVKAGDAVRAGELLVSGIFESETGGRRTVRADARVYARTVQTLRVEIPLAVTETVRTGQSYRNFTLKIFNFSINLYFGGGISYDVYDKINQIADARIGSFLLPISLITHTYYQKETVSTEVSPEQAAAAAEQMLEMREQQEFFGCEYLCTDRWVIRQDGCAVAQGEYVRVRDIATAVPIE